MSDRLLAASPIDTALRAALPPAGGTLNVRVLDDLRVLALRHLPGGAPAIEAVLAAHALAPLPRPGRCDGADPWLAWIGPSECLLLTASHGAIADHLLQALAPGREALACALDRSAGCLAFELLGTAIDDLLPRLFDASAIPGQAGRASRTRFIDIGAVLMRLDPDRAWLLVDRPHGLYAAQWIAHALQAAAEATPTWPASLPPAHRAAP